MSNASDIPTVDVTAARDQVATGAVMLDVREPEEWHAGHAADAVWIPMEEIETRHAELPADAAIVVMCRSGNRSAMVTQALMQAGYDASNIAGGMHAWAEAGFAVVTESGAPGSVA